MLEETKSQRVCWNLAEIELPHQELNLLSYKHINIPDKSNGFSPPEKCIELDTNYKENFEGIMSYLNTKYKLLRDLQNLL